MFAKRTIERWLLLFKVLAVFLLAVALLAFILPATNTPFADAYLAWMKHLALGIPLRFAVEFVGDKFLGLPIFARLSSHARIAVTTIVMLIILTFVLVANFVRHG